MRRFITCLFVTLLAMQGKAQLSTYQWSNKVAAAATGKKAIIDAAGNIYVWVNAAPPVTIGSTTYTSTFGSADHYLVKYDANGNITWSREIKMAVYNMAFNTDSTALLFSGLLQSNYNSIDFGNGISSGSAFNSAGMILKVDAATSNTLWIKGYDPTIPTLTTAKPVHAVQEINGRMFSVQGLKIRRLDTDGNEIWNRLLVANGTTYSLENKNFNSFADAAGNTFYSGVSDQGNTTSLTLNGTTYTLLGNNNVCRTYFSLDADGNTNWIRPNVNFQFGKNVEVSAAGEIVAGGYHIYNGFSAGQTNHPFKPDFCNRDYNVFKANIKTGLLIWEAYAGQVGNVNSSGFHLAADGNLYVVGHQQTASSIWYNIGTISRSFKPIAAPGQYMTRINSNGVPDSAFSINTFSGSSVNTLDFSIINLYRNPAGKFVMLFNKKSNAMNFANGNANQNSTTVAVQGLLQFTPPALSIRHATTWTGTTNGVWTTASNWSNGVPTDSSNVIIPAGAPNYPQADYQLYDYSTSQWVKCGNLFIQQGASLYFGIGGNRVSGIIHNEGTLIYKNDVNNSYYEFSAWGDVAERAYIMGNGTIKYTGGLGGIIPNFKSGNNTVEIALNNTTDSLFFRECNSFKNLYLTKGNITFQNTNNNRFYVDSNFQFTPPARVYGGNITATLRSNQSVTFPIGNSTAVQPATISLFNSPMPVYLTAGFSTTINGAAPNPATTTLNGQAFSALLNRGIWTISANSSLSAGAYYNAEFKLTGSTNTANASRYALLKRDNSSSDWAVAGTYQPARDSSGYAISGATNITSFSDFAIGIADAVLPIFTVNLSVNKQAMGNRLTWKIIATDGEKIDIQRSSDGRSFELLARVPYATNGYHTDATAIERLWYRLKVTDKQGNEKYSNIVTINGRSSQQVQVYPTLVRDVFYVQNNVGEKLQIQVVDANGRMVWQQQVQPGTNVITAQHWNAGVFHYRLMKGTEHIQSGKLVRQ